MRFAPCLWLLAACAADARTGTPPGRVMDPAMPAGPVGSDPDMPPTPPPPAGPPAVDMPPPPVESFLCGRPGTWRIMRPLTSMTGPFCQMLPTEEVPLVPDEDFGSLACIPGCACANAEPMLPECAVSLVVDCIGGVAQIQCELILDEPTHMSGECVYTVMGDGQSFQCVYSFDGEWVGASS